MAGRLEETNFFGENPEKLKAPTPLEIAIKKLKAIDEQYVLDRIDVPAMETKIDGAYDKADYISHLWEIYVIADILGYIFVGILALFFFMIAYLFKKNEVVKYVFMFIGLVIAVIGGDITKSAIDSVARSSKMDNIEIQRFDYSDNMVVNVDVLNTGKFDYEECIVNFTFYKKTDRLPINLVNKIKPLHVQVEKIKDIKKQTYKHIRFTIYTISQDLNFTMEHEQACK